MQTIGIKIKKLHPDAIVPKQQTAGAACFDLHSIGLHAVVGGTDSVTQVFRTGLAFQIPEDKVMLVFSRSGHGFKNDIRLSNCTGVIDPDYTGEVMVKLRADSQTPEGTLHVKSGDRIAQALLVPRYQYEFELAEELDETERGDGGFGSTGTSP